MSKWFLYIARTNTGRFYVGITTDPNRRITEHNSGKGAFMAIEQGPFELVYASQAFHSKSVARKREIQVKDWSQAKKLKLISGKWN